MKTQKKTLKSSIHYDTFFFQYCPPDQNHPKSHILFHKNGYLPNFYIMILLMYQITCRFDRKNHFIHVNLLGFFLDSLEILECFCLSYTFLVNFVHQRILLQSDICLEIIEKRYKVIVTLQVITTQINSLVVSSTYN